MSGGEMVIYIYRKDSGLLPAERLLRSAAEYCQARGLGSPPATVGRGGSGKPYFPDRPTLGFSVSHSGGYWAAAFLPGEVGLDLQQFRGCRFEAIAGRFFHPEEALYVGKDPARFFEVWAAKESYVKFTGEGITRRFPAFSVCSPETLRPPARIFPVGFLPGYAMCAAAEAVSGVSVVRR